MLASTPIGLALLQGKVCTDIPQVFDSHNTAADDVDGDRTNVVQAGEVGADVGVDADEDAEPEVDYLMDHPPDNAGDIDPEQIEVDVAVDTTPGLDGVALNPPATLVDNMVSAPVDVLADPYAIVAQPASGKGEGTPIALAEQSNPREVFLMLDGTRT
jgi:hypothetical protein